jgi:hypothetical protein
MSGDILSKLPPDLQSVLRKKCSRDPTTRFTHKIQLLLAFAVSNSALAFEIGIGWVSEYAFRINKRRLIEVLGIKMNSMNCNLHDQGFRKMEHEKNGWSRWTRPGFTQNRILTHPSEHFPPDSRPSPIIFPGLNLNFSLGVLHPESCESFMNDVVRLWVTVITPDLKAEVRPNLFVERLASLLRAPEQPFANASSVLTALLLSGNPSTMSIVDFVMFLARFGPSETAMLKIASLVSATGDGCKCISFNSGEEKLEEVKGMPFCGVFDDRELNRLTLVFPFGGKQSVWNVPVIDAYGYYLLDDASKTHRSWEDYFEHRVKHRIASVST